MSSKKSNLIFLHGLSGAGKGELQRIITAQYLGHEYEVVAVSSGELFREAKNDPEIAAQMQAGKFPLTLALIIPGLKSKYREFLQLHKAKEGKAIMILDGTIRRAIFESGGESIPSQIDQMAVAFYEVRQEEGYLTETMPLQIAQEIRDSKHILVDVMPEDAELQMRKRVEKEILQVQRQLAEHDFPAALAPQIIEFLPELIAAIQEVVDTEVTDANYTELKRHFVELRGTLFALAELTLAPSLLELMQKMDLIAELRDDDILAETRRKRIENLLVKKDGRYEPGFAATALEEVGIYYDVELQRFMTSEGRDNCVVIENGYSRGVDFELFKSRCTELSMNLVAVDDEGRLSERPSGESTAHRRLGGIET